MSNITEALKTDIALVNGDLVLSSGGDLALISGIANLKAALFHRLVTVPGTLVHKPTYGVGITQYENSCSSFSVQQKLATLIQEQFALDPRVQSVDTVSISSEDGTPQMTVIKVFITPIGYSDGIPLTYTPFSAGIT
jgi:phage baseplate assembly protein W